MRPFAADQGYDDGDPPAFALRELGGALTLISDQNGMFNISINTNLSSSHS